MLPLVRPRGGDRARTRLDIWPVPATALHRFNQRRQQPCGPVDWADRYSRPACRSPKPAGGGNPTTLEGGTERADMAATEDHPRRAPL